jgi:hypothetical protein
MSPNPEKVCPEHVLSIIVVKQFFMVGHYYIGAFISIEKVRRYRCGEKGTIKKESFRF